MGEQVAAGFLKRNPEERETGNETCTLKIAYRKRYNIFIHKKIQDIREKTVSSAEAEDTNVHENEQTRKNQTLITLYERKNWSS